MTPGQEKSGQTQSGQPHWEAMADTGLAELSIPVWRRFCD